MASYRFLQRPLRYRFYNATLALIVACVAVFLLSTAWREATTYLGLVPVLVLRQGWLWQLVTYMFVHGGITHILLNMLALFMFGGQIERRLGSNEYLAYYFVSGVGAGLVTLVMNGLVWKSMAMVPVVGASGAIYGLLLAYATLFPDSVIFVLGILPLRAPVAVLLFAAIALVSQFLNLQSGVAHLTHLSGLAFGYLYFRVRLRMDPIKLLTHR
jgi:membrane associated rhomboid family serine protease